VGAGVSGERSGLMRWVPTLRSIFRRAFPDCQHADLCEMVASLTAANQKHYDVMNQGLPVRICSSDFTWVRRPRLYWISWAVQQQVGVQEEETPRWTTLRLRHQRMPLKRWVKRGWRPFLDYPTFPTFVRATIRKKPPFMPAGIKLLRKHELARYAQHKFIYPPYQFQDKHLLWNPKRKLVPATAEMREVLMGYDRDYTHAVWSAGNRRANPLGFELARCSLLGNTFHAGVVAWLLGHLMAEWDILARPALVSEVADPCRPAGLGHRAVPMGQETMQLEDLGNDAELLLQLVRFYFGRQSHRGGEVSWLGEVGAGSAQVPKAIDPREWLWYDAISTKWKILGEHINTLECRALILALRWRFRQSTNVHSKFLHLVDSRVTSGMVAKGRTSSWTLRRTLGKVNALLLAAHSSMVLGFCRTHLNPADSPSRREGRIRKAKGADSSSGPSSLAADSGQPDGQ